MHFPTFLYAAKSGKIKFCELKVFLRMSYYNRDIPTPTLTDPADVPVAEDRRVTHVDAVGGGG